jgi:GTP pyrophosphokinase
MENHQTYIDRFRLKVSEEDLQRIEFAYDLAKYAHREQCRDDGERYFEHLRASSLIAIDELGITDPDIHIAILLHDVIEDSYLLSYHRIKLIFGKKIAKIVSNLSKPPINNPQFKTKQERNDYYFSNMTRWQFEEQLCKLVDRLHNIRTISNCKPAKQKRKIAETQEYFKPLVNQLKQTHPEIGIFFETEFKKIIPNF